ALLKKLRSDTAESELSCQKEPLTSADLQALADILAENLLLVKIDLRECGVDVAGAQALGAALKLNKTLKELDLRWNADIGDEGCKALAEGLAENRSLERIDLGGCRIATAGAQALGTALKANGTLKDLYLGYNDALGAEGCEALAEGILRNVGLVEVNLKWCDVPEVCEKALAAAAEGNPTLQLLQVRS
ncbi:NLRC3, partial [Symbiodinium natans]